MPSRRHAANIKLFVIKTDSSDARAAIDRWADASRIDFPRHAKKENETENRPGLVKWGCSDFEERAIARVKSRGNSSDIDIDGRLHSGECKLIDGNVTSMLKFQQCNCDVTHVMLHLRCRVGSYNIEIVTLCVNSCFAGICLSLSAAV